MRDSSISHELSSTRSGLSGLFFRSSDEKLDICLRVCDRVRANKMDGLDFCNIMGMNRGRGTGTLVKLKHKVPNTHLNRT